MPNLPYLRQICPKNTACDSYILITNNAIELYDISLFESKQILCTEDSLKELGYNFFRGGNSKNPKIIFFENRS